MKNTITCLALLLTTATFSQVGIGTTNPNSNAELEIVSTNRGLLIPRIALTATNAFAPLSAHVQGMMVYNTATAGTAPNNVSPGNYYNDGAKWVRIADAAAIPSTIDASVDALVNDNANTMVKLGTQSDNVTARSAGTDFVVKDNGTVAIGTATPNANAMLDVTSTTKGLLLPRLALTATNAFAPLSAYVQGMAVYNTATAGVAPNNVTPGYYYNDGAKWVRIADAAAVPSTIDASVDALVNDNANTMVKLGTQSDNVTARSVGTDFVMKDNGTVGIGTATPNTNAILDVTSTTKGLLLPRLALTATNAFAPLSAYVQGMAVYNTVTAGVTPNNVTPGYYYNDGAKWVRIADAAAVPSTIDASIDALVNDNANTMVKLGTQSDNVTARTAGTEFVVKDTGNVGIGTTAPNRRLEINSGVLATPPLRFTQQTAAAAATSTTNNTKVVVVNTTGDVLTKVYEKNYSPTGGNIGSVTCVALPSVIAPVTLPADASFFGTADGNWFSTGGGAADFTLPTVANALAAGHKTGDVFVISHLSALNNTLGTTNTNLPSNLLLSGNVSVGFVLAADKWYKIF